MRPLNTQLPAEHRGSAEAQTVMAMNKDEILEIEKGFWEKANDPDFFKNNLTDDGLTIMEPLGYLDKHQALEMSAKGKPFRDVKMQDVHIKELTPDCVAVAYHGEGTRDGDKEPYRGNICSIYVKREGSWKLAIADHQPWRKDK